MIWISECESVPKMIHTVGGTDFIWRWGGRENDICEDECALLEQTLASLFSLARANGSSSP